MEMERIRVERRGEGKKKIIKHEKERGNNVTGKRKRGKKESKEETFRKGKRKWKE